MNSTSILNNFVILIFLPSTPITLNKSPLSFNEHGVPCVPEHGAFKLHPWFISDAFGFTINLTAVQTSIATKNVNRSSLCLDHWYKYFMMIHVCISFLGKTIVNWLWNFGHIHHNHKPISHLKLMYDTNKWK